MILKDVMFGGIKYVVQQIIYLKEIVIVSVVKIDVNIVTFC